MAVRITQQNCNESVGSPFINNHVLPHNRGNDAWQRPDRLNQTDKSTFIKFLTQPGDCQQCQNMEDIIRDS